ncbi:MAG: S-layer homology domain-containing protein [Propionibacteriaceae bacterium]|jgi:hypothetical protein|nr:S-layer homology domain-containing protein [Propionibacteriaceae bacterium]
MLARRLATLALAPALALTALVTLASPAQADDNVVPDPEFRACLNGFLGAVADAPITPEQLSTLTWPLCSDYFAGATTLEGAQYLTNALGLVIHNHGVPLQDLSQLSGLTSVVYLILEDAKIADISSLATATGLHELHLTNNDIKDVGPLANLTSLSYLVLSNNDVSDVSALSGLAALTPSEFVQWGYVNLDNNHVVDLSALSPLPPAIAVSDFAEGVSARDQTSTWTTTAGTHDLPIKQLPDGDAKCVQYGFTQCLKTQPMTVTVTGGTGGATYNADGTITFPESPTDQTYTVTWSATALVSTDGGTYQNQLSPYFSGTLTVTVPGTGSTTPTTPTPTPTTPSTPATPSVPLGQVAPSYCGVTNAPVSGPVNRFLDVLATTPHSSDITWLADNGYSIGWSVSCSHTTSTGSHLVASGAGYTLAAGNNPAGYGLFTDSAYESNQGTVGYIFQPWNQVTRGDAAVWLAKLALSDQNINLNNPASVKSFLDGKYAITNLSWAQGPDGQWGTQDDAKTVTIPVGHTLYQEFTDITANFGTPTTDDRHGAAVTWLANTIVNATFDNNGNLTSGQRLSDGFPAGNAREYRPLAPIARQDMAAFLYRIALYEQQTGEHSGINLTVSQDMPGYTAHGEAVRWLAGTQITTGYPDGTFGGLLPVIRQDLAAFLHRADGVINK